MAGVQDLLGAAASRYGYIEGPNNDTEFGQWYGLNNEPWCDMFVTWCGAVSGNGDVVGHFAYCPSHVNWFQGNGQWHGWTETPQVGDIVFYNWEGTHGTADHVGIVIAVTNDPQHPVIAREGNSGNTNTSDGIGVFDHNRSVQWIVGYGRPDYAAAQGTTSANAPVNPALTQPDWDGTSYPGAAAFALGSMHPAVTKLGEMLVAHGFGAAYKEGPGVPMGPADVANCAAFQHAQGWTGADADGYPGPETWRLLELPATQDAPAQVTVSLSAIIDSAKVDPGAPQGYQSHGDNTIIVERALAAEGLLDNRYVDGSYGTLTVQAYAAWQRRCGYSGSAADGIPGNDSLTKLGQKYGFGLRG